jgi:hypothetical protein
MLSHSIEVIKKAPVSGAFFLVLQESNVTSSPDSLHYQWQIFINGVLWHSSTIFAFMYTP